MGVGSWGDGGGGGSGRVGVRLTTWLLGSRSFTHFLELSKKFFKNLNVKASLLNNSELLSFVRSQESVLLSGSIFYA